MPRRIVVALILITLGILTTGKYLTFNVIYWLPLILAVLYIVSGALILKCQIIGHYIAIPTIIYSIYRNVNYIINMVFYSNEPKNLWQILRFDIPNIAIFILSSLCFFLLALDLIKFKITTNYQLKVSKLNEPELWLYPWLITLLLLYCLSFGADVEVALLMAILLPILLFFIHRFLKRNNAIEFNNFKKLYNIGFFSWLVFYVGYLSVLGYFLLVYARGMAGL